MKKIEKIINIAVPTVIISSVIGPVIITTITHGSPCMGCIPLISMVMLTIGFLFLHLLNLLESIQIRRDEIELLKKMERELESETDPRIKYFLKSKISEYKLKFKIW